MSSKAQDALEAIRNPAVVRAFDDARKYIHQKWEASQSLSEREDAWFMLKALDVVKGELHSAAVGQQFKTDNLGPQS